jgi:hypothetical protein
MVKLVKGCTLAAALIITSAVMAQQGTWQEYRSGGGFIVRLPGVPTIESQLVSNPAIGGSVTLNTATVGLKVGGYATAYADFPLNYVFPRKEALDGARDKIIQSLGATLREEQSLSIAGNPARDVFADIPKRGGVVRCRLILTAQNRLIELMYAGLEGTEASESVNYFMNSLVILNESTKAARQ